MFAPVGFFALGGTFEVATDGDEPHGQVQSNPGAANRPCGSRIPAADGMRAQSIHDTDQEDGKADRSNGLSEALSVSNCWKTLVHSSILRY